MQGQYLGSATLIYGKASSATNAIKQFNGAQLDDRTMKIEYATPQQIRVPSPQQSNKGSQKIKAVKQPLTMRRGNNAIQKRGNGAGSQN